MKTTIIIILFFASSFMMHSQTIGVQPHQFYYKGDTTLLLDHPDFKSENFIFGWHWCYGRSLTNALNFNSIHYAIDNIGIPRPHYRTATELNSIWF